MRWDSPLSLAIAGTVAVHTFLVIGADALVLTHPFRLPKLPPHVQLIDVHVPVPKPPPPPVIREPDPTPLPAPDPTPVQHTRTTPAAQPPVSHEPPPPPDTPTSPDPGGSPGPSMKMDDIAPAATGVPVAKTSGKGTGIGKTGTGTGTGTGAGTGSGEAPMSVATIKTPAMPVGDTSYLETKDYPAEAKQLGIEGAIRVKLVVDEHGKVKSRTLLNHLGHGLDELALARAAAIEFTPARDSEDRAVSSVVVWTFHMTLPK